MPALMCLYVASTAAALAGSWLARSNPYPWMQVVVGLNVFMTLMALGLFTREIRGFQTLLDDIEAVRVATLRGDAAK